MKLVKQASLVFQEGRSDKVYEVDLCETAQNLFVVNFRYGRRGGNIKEGSKTLHPVPLAEAEKAFNELVSSKTKKGYRDSNNAAPVKQSASRTEFTVDENARNQAVLNRLTDASPSRGKKQWSLDRAIWRAGELRISAAAEPLIKLLGTGDVVRDYSIIWSLGWCGDASVIPTITSIRNDKSKPDHVRRIAAEALLKLWTEDSIAQFRDEVIKTLPAELRELASKGTEHDFARALKEYLDTEDHKRFAVLDAIYLIDNEHVRPALLETLRTAPMRNNYFQRIRHIFKAAEYRRDAEVFGIVAHRFEKSQAMFSSAELSLKKSYSWVMLPGNIYIHGAGDEIIKNDSRIGYGSRTRIYLRKRVWRTLRRLGEIGDSDYVKMTVGVLLPYSDADAQEVRHASVYNPRVRSFLPVHWDAYASYWAFNHILYGRSPRYFLKPSTRAWRCSAQYKPGDPAPDVREETFPKLWEQNPVGLLHLISESQCLRVHEFAARALRDCKEFCAELDSEAIIMILSRSYEPSARLGFELARERCQTREPNRQLVLAAAHSNFAEARTEAQRWIDSNRAYFLSDVGFVTALATGTYADTREYARNLLRASNFSDDVSRSIISNLVNTLVSFDVAEAERAKDISDTLLAAFTPQLRSIDMQVVIDLLSSPLKEVQELGANILLNHSTKPQDMPSGVIDSLIASPFDSIRGIGIKLFSGLDVETLLRSEQLIVSFATHEHEDIRNLIRPVIHRLSQSNAQFAERMKNIFIEELWGAEVHAGVHKSLSRILQEDSGEEWIDNATPSTAWKLIQSPSMDAQELGGVLIELKIKRDATWAENFETTDIVELSSHNIAAVRRAARLVFDKVISRYQHASNPEDHLEEMTRAVRLLDSEWEDAREYFISQFKTQFTAKDFSPAILVSVCDSVRTDIQALGRELITRFFEDESGQEYLLKLSEHPSADLQLFATNYLERYAANDPEKLVELNYYFTSVLSRINKARVAKDRVIAFLMAEAVKSEDAARTVAAIFARQSATIAKGDRAAAIDAMLRINRLYPHITLPIRVREPEVRHAG
jgi:predicted DNA-binding WGR domain protein